MGQHMSPTKVLSVGDELVEREANRGIVGRDDSAGARADDDVDGNPVRDELLQDPDVSGAAQSSAAEHHADSYWGVRIACAND